MEIRGLSSQPYNHCPPSSDFPRYQPKADEDASEICYCGPREIVLGNTCVDKSSHESSQINTPTEPPSAEVPSHDVTPTPTPEPPSVAENKLRTNASETLETYYPNGQVRTKLTSNVNQQSQTAVGTSDNGIQEGLQDRLLTAIDRQNVCNPAIDGHPECERRRQLVNRLVSILGLAG